MIIEKNNIYNIDCIVGMRAIEDKSVDMILCDLPYGITSCKWDALIPFNLLWAEYKRIIKDNGAIVLTSAQPFTTELINSNRKMYRYNWYWMKNTVTGFTFAKYQPMRCVEDICVFYKQVPTYNPQGLIKLDKPKKHFRNKSDKEMIYDNNTLSGNYVSKYTNYPRNVLHIKSERGLHPTQKPVELFEYLIQTYTNEGDLVLDNCMGSGTTAIAAINTDREYIGFELDKQHYTTAKERIDNVKNV